MRIIDCFSDIFVYTLYLLESVGDGEAVDMQSANWQEDQAPQMQQLPELKPPVALKPAGAEAKKEKEAENAGAQSPSEYTFSEVYDTYRRLFNNCADLKRKGNFPAEDFELAKFAVCAWVDEVINLSNWKDKMQWPSVELQRQFYMTNNAGEEFYQKLCALKRPQSQVLEVYATCLALGFKGCYYERFASEELESLKRSACSRFLGCSPEEDNLKNRRIFPQGYTTPAAAETVKRKKSMMKWATATCCFAVPVVVLITLQIIYSSILNQMLGNILKLLTD